MKVKELRYLLEELPDDEEIDVNHLNKEIKKKYAKERLRDLKEKAHPSHNENWGDYTGLAVQHLIDLVLLEDE